MPWFRVDDSFYDHPKALAAGPALALWLRAGCYSARHLTDGFVSRDALRQLGGTPAMAKRLVDAKARPEGYGLWVTIDGGWRFHDWDRYQPSRELIEERRRKRAEAGRLGGMASGAARKAEASGEAIASADASTTYEPPARPGPARPQNPLLTLAGRLGEIGPNDLAAGLPSELIDEWRAIAGPGVDLDAEARAYLARHGDTAPRDPRGAWLGWLRQAARRTQHAADGSAVMAAPLVEPSTGNHMRPPAWTPCPDHPDHPAGRCPACEALAVPAPKSLRHNKTREAS